MEVVKDVINSKLNISDDVIITIARLATLDVKGVAGLSGEINALSKIKNNAVMCIVFAVFICIVIKTDITDNNGIAVKQPHM